MNLNFLMCSRISAALLLLALIFSMNTLLKAQSNGLPYTELEINTLDHFESPSGNWEIAGSVFMDLFTRHDVQPESGSGVLVNTSEGDSPLDIFTKFKHGDLDLELEFMMAKESNSGIYFQGRYELQLLDCWGVQYPKFYDMGDRVHTHTAAVGYPGGVNFAFDQNNGSIMKIWKGEFINANSMWVGRGGGNLSLNEDATINMSGAPSLAYLRENQAPWPDSLQQGIDYRFNSYQFSAAYGQMPARHCCMMLGTTH